MKHHCKKDFGQKIFFVMFFALQNVAFSTSERRMLLTVKRSRDRSLWRKKLCCYSTVIGKMADSKKKAVFVGSFRGRNRWKNKLHEWFLNTGHIVSYFPQKSCRQAEMAEICTETVGSVDFKAPTTCPVLCSWHFENACSIDCLFLKCTLLEQSLRKVLRKDCEIEVGPETPQEHIINNNFCNLSWHCATVWSLISDADSHEPDERLTKLSICKISFSSKDKGELYSGKTCRKTF